MMPKTAMLALASLAASALGVRCATATSTLVRGAVAAATAAVPLSPRPRMPASRQQEQRMFRKQALAHAFTPKRSSHESSPPETAARNYPLVWIDLEMTGLDLEKDTIIEVACVVTDGITLSPMDEGLHLVIHQPKSVMDNMNAWCIEHHGKSGLTNSVLASNLTLKDAESRLLDYIQKHVPSPRKAILAGNSVHVDRQFLQKRMPSIVDHLHYRIVDVSTIKELSARWFPDKFRTMPKKLLCHRAMDDITESIHELMWYRDNVFVQPSSAARRIEDALDSTRQ